MVSPSAAIVRALPTEGFHTFAPTKGGPMSSTSKKPYLTSSDLDMLQSVLDNAGYEARIAIDDGKGCNVAAVLLIKLFQEGVTSPAKLSQALEHYFGKLKTPPKPVTPVYDRYAIQGLPSDRRKTNLKPDARS
ncbi:hypothetical protein EFR00_22860 [Rhizobium sophoriradicis]|jgi:hypothetical protein|nr:MULTISPECIES: hypothetical protein [Rhizobium]AJC78548.1 hypothetical protein IE4803_CH01311 [Rhizobium etli bv. phaseoli str. IE4803]ARQ57531.1 hypothetical protein Kim5_CH01434 [Rhizobium sp. Kim5]RSB92099.1 hypothetical protein EFR00_22860 [Rhizobium sophoriradicis]